MIDTGDRVYAAETISYAEVTDPKLNDGVIEAGGEGTVAEVIDAECCNVLVEWDAGFLGAAEASSIAVVPTLANPGVRVQPGNLYPCLAHVQGHWSAQAAISCNETMRPVTS